MLAYTVDNSYMYMYVQPVGTLIEFFILDCF